MLLFLDTETTGLPNYSLPLIHPSQPRLVELAAWLGTDDVDCTMEATLNCVIKPDGWQISDGALRAHGITLEYAQSFGEPAADVINRLAAMVRTADEDSPGQSRIIAHNVQFDTRILLAEFLHAGASPATLNMLLPFCTMRSLTSRMKLPGKHAHTYKWPTLDEAYRYCFDCEVPTTTGERHRAMPDLLACKDVFLHGRSQGWWS